MQVTNWIDWGKGTYMPIEDSPYHWEDVMMAVADALRENGYAFSGSYHQSGKNGVPIIDGKWRYEVSMRTWGRTMALARGGEYDEMAYANYAWELPEGVKEIVPDVKIIQKTIRFVGKKELS